MATMETRAANGVSFALTDEQKELRALARDFAEKEVRPKAPSTTSTRRIRRTSSRRPTRSVS